jgi:hypothetical protein
MRKTLRGGRRRAMAEVMAAPDQPPKPTLNLEGDQAKALHGLKPGTALELALTGTIRNLGFRSYGEKAPTAEVEITRTRVAKRPARRP